MNKEEIKKILPHREPMLLVDEVELIDGKAFGKCHIRGDEYFLQGHFPGNPIVPGVIQCEMLAQSACVLLADGASEGMTPVFTSLDKVKFRDMVKPGDTLETECELVRQRGMFYFAKGTGRVNGKICVSAEFSFALVKSVSPAERNRLCLRNCLSRTAAKSRCALFVPARKWASAPWRCIPKADAESIHVALADEAICIGEAAAKDSYLNQERIISAAICVESAGHSPRLRLFGGKCFVCRSCAKSTASRLSARPANSSTAWAIRTPHAD